MTGDATPVWDLVDTMLAGDTLSTRPGGGETDAWRALTPKARRRIISLRWASPRGLPVDVLAMRVGERFGRDFTPNELIDWLAACAPHVVVERRRAAHRRRHDGYALRHAAPTYYALRTRRALVAGYPSLHALCLAKGWRTRRSDTADRRAA